MLKAERTLNQLYVASPCTANWEAMLGDEQKRFCSQCQLNVYNVSAMTKAQAEELIRQTEGKLCIKLYRRADGTIITQDCPVGLKAVRKKISRVATATFGFLMSLFTSQTVGWADDGHKYCKHFTATITKLQPGENTVVIAGVVADITEAVIANAKVILTNEETKQVVSTKTDGEGKYRISSLPAGIYAIRIESPGFASFNKEKLKMSENEMLQLNVTMQVGSVGGSAFLQELRDGNPSQARRV